MTDAARVWKTMSSEQKEEYTVKAELYNSSESKAALVSEEPKSSKAAPKNKALKLSKRKRSAYQIYIAESVKAGVKLGDAASAWKTLSEEEKAKYGKLAALQVESTNA